MCFPWKSAKGSMQTVFPSKHTHSSILSHDSSYQATKALVRASRLDVTFLLAAIRQRGGNRNFSIGATRSAQAHSECSPPFASM